MLTLLLVPPSQVLNYSEAFYAPPVVMVTVSHLYDSNNVYSVKPENNVLNAWIEVRKQLITLENTITYHNALCLSPKNFS